MVQSSNRSHHTQEKPQKSPYLGSAFIIDVLSTLPPSFLMPSSSGFPDKITNIKPRISDWGESRKHFLNVNLFDVVQGAWMFPVKTNGLTSISAFLSAVRLCAVPSTAQRSCTPDRSQMVVENYLICLSASILLY